MCVISPAHAATQSSTSDVNEPLFRYGGGAWNGEVARASSRRASAGSAAGNRGGQVEIDVVRKLRPAVRNVVHPTLDPAKVRAVLSDVPCRPQTRPIRRRWGRLRRRRRCSDGGREEEGAVVMQSRRRSAGSEFSRLSVRYQRRMSVVMQFWGPVSCDRGAAVYSPHHTGPLGLLLDWTGHIETQSDQKSKCWG